MPIHVTLTPSHQHFDVADGETLLEAGLRAGLGLNYGCNNGNCGLCKARVIKGDTSRIRHHDYIFSEAEKAQGQILMCACTATTDVELEALTATAAREIQLQDITARVYAIKPLAPHVRLLHLQTPRSNRLRFLAGQSVALSIGDDAGAYPIASCPCDERNLQFHIVERDNDAFAQHVFHRLRSGEGVQVYGPVGDLVLDQASTRPLLMIAADTGFAPIKSLAEHAMSLETAQPVDMVWISGTEGHYFSNICHAWEDALDSFRYHELTLDDTDIARAAQVEAYLTTKFGALGAFDGYIAGPAGFCATLRDYLIRRGMPAAQIFSAAV